MLKSFKSIHYPKELHPIVISQKYAGAAYLWLTISLVVLIVYRLSLGFNVFYTGIIGVFLSIFLSNVFAVIKMRKTITEVGFYNDNFYINNVYDLVRDHETLMFPLHYANPKNSSEGLIVHYFGRVFILKQEDWDDENWEGMLGEFVR